MPFNQSSLEHKIGRTAGFLCSILLASTFLFLILTLTHRLGQGLLESNAYIVSLAIVGLVLLAGLVVRRILK